MKRLNDHHTTLLLVLLDGTHRTTSYFNGTVDFNRIKRDMWEQKNLCGKTNKIIWAVLACGQQVQQYNEREVEEFTVDTH